MLLYFAGQDEATRRGLVLANDLLTDQHVLDLVGRALPPRARLALHDLVDALRVWA